MKKFKLLFLLIVLGSLTACSSMNSKFSCNATAGDGCMSLDDVNAMTEGKPLTSPSPQVPKRPHSLMKADVKRIWIAPWSDGKGTKHQGELVFVPELSEGETA